MKMNFVFWSRASSQWRWTSRDEVGLKNRIHEVLVSLGASLLKSFISFNSSIGHSAYSFFCSMWWRYGFMSWRPFWKWFESRIPTSSSYEASHKRWSLRSSSLWLFSLWSMISLSCCLMISMMSQTSCNPKTMSIKALRVTSSFMVYLSLHNESSILLLHNDRRTFKDE